LSNYRERLEARGTAIRAWLAARAPGGLPVALERIDEGLERIDSAALRSELDLAGVFEDLADEGHQDAAMVMFLWTHNAWQQADGYSFEAVEGTDDVSRTDLGPDELPGIETELEEQGEIDEVAGLVIDEALAPWRTELADEFDRAVAERPVADAADVRRVCEELFRIELYRTAVDAAEDCRAQAREAGFGGRQPFFIAFKQHGRWAIPVLRLDG